MPMGTGPVIHTVGHSTRSAADFVALLRASGIECLVDVRRFPSSRRHPQFGRDALRATLHAVGIEYLHEEVLGGHREPQPDSVNAGLAQDALRGYADHMCAPAFRLASERVLARAERCRLALMCAEALPGRCHRAFLADHLTVRGARVVHLLAPGSSAEHSLSPLARVEPDGDLSYPSPVSRQLDLFDAFGP